jgi:hypothetical protein
VTFSCHRFYTLNSIMSLTHSYSNETLGNGCSWFKSHFLLSHFSPLYDKFCHKHKLPKKSTHTLTLRHVSICGVSTSYSCSSFSCATCWMLVHPYVTSSGKTKWSGPHRTIKMLHFVLFHSVTCYTKSIVSRIHVNATKLRNITCTLVATCVILRSLECNCLAPC